MALGTLGSTLNDELNRLANGGTYRDMNQMVDEALAAKQWANRENINPYSTDTVGILNEIAGLGLDKKNWLDFNGVCNYIAGTTGLPAAAALRQVYPTTDLLTGVASYYVDATAPTNWGSLGYVYLNGVNGNYLSVPDAANLRITGDIDIRARVAADDWTPASDILLMSRWMSAGNTSWRLILKSNGTLNLLTTSNGTTVVVNALSTVATGVTDGDVKWVRVTLDVDNGAGGNTTTFFTSDDGTNWTQLGSPVVTAGTTSIFAGTSMLEIGSNSTGQNVFIGKVYRAQILNGIGGTTVLDVNIAANYTAASQSFFTATTGQTVTVNGVDTIANLGAAGSLLPTTLGSSTAADSNDPKFLDFTGTNYVYLPSAGTNYVATGSITAFNNDLDIRANIALDDWTPAVDQRIFSNNQGDPNRWVNFIVATNGTLKLQWYPTGSSASFKEVQSTASAVVADGGRKWIRATLDVDNGASGNTVTFYTSDDGTTWTQLGTPVVTAGTTNLNASTGLYGIGVTGNTDGVKLFNLQVLQGIAGTPFLNIDTSVITAGSATSFTAVTGQTVTINRSSSGRKTVAVTQPTWLFGTDDYMEVNNRYMSSGTYLYLPGVVSNYATTVDAAPLDITGDIDIRVKVAMDDWTPSGVQNLVAKWGLSGNQRSYRFYLNTDGKLLFWRSTDGANQGSWTSSVAPTVADGATLWVRVTFDVDNGAGGSDAIFYTSNDGTTWTQLGTTITAAGTTSIFSGASPLEIGSQDAGTNNFARGKFFRAQVRNGINGTVAFDANFETSITSLNQTSFTESSANAATVTINRSGSAYRSAGITAAGYLYPGATNTFAASATDFLSFSATDSYTLIAAIRYWNATASNRVIIGKMFSSNGDGYSLIFSTNTLLPAAVLDDGILTGLIQTTTAVTSGQMATITGSVNRSTQLIAAYLNTGSASQSSTSTRGAAPYITQAFPLRIGSYNESASFTTDMEFMAGAVFRTALTPTQIRQIANYFANREVYL